MAPIAESGANTIVGTHFAEDDFPEEFEKSPEACAGDSEQLLDSTVALDAKEECSEALAHVKLVTDGLLLMSSTGISHKKTWQPVHKSLCFGKVCDLYHKHKFAVTCVKIGAKHDCVACTEIQKRMDAKRAKWDVQPTAPPQQEGQTSAPPPPSSEPSTSSATAPAPLTLALVPIVETTPPNIIVPSRKRKQSEPGCSLFL